MIFHKFYNNKIRWFMLLFGPVLIFLLYCAAHYLPNLQKNDRKIFFGICPDYPPFEFYENGKLTGFDIELAQMIAVELQKQAEFKNMSFSCIFPSLNSGAIDAGISTITVNNERSINFDFSTVYYQERMSVVYRKEFAITNANNMDSKNIACQLGTTMEIWLKNNTSANIVAMDNTNQCVEALKAKHVDGVFIDSYQAKAFIQKDQQLESVFIEKSQYGYAICLPKGSNLKPEIDKALAKLKADGSLQRLINKWIGPEYV